MFVKTSYTAEAEVYAVTIVQSMSGQRRETWDYENPTRTIDCLVRSFNSSSMRGAITESVGVRVLEGDLLLLKTDAVLSEDDRIGAITNKKTGQLMHVDYDRNPDNPTEVLKEATIYEIVGSYPIEDFFGNVIEHAYALEAARDR